TEEPNGRNRRPMGGGATRSEMRVTQEDRQHWSFVPLKAVVPPGVEDTDWLRTSVDSFIRHAQEEQSIIPSLQVDATKLVRRVFFNLIGLPPSPAEMDYWTERIERSREEMGVLVDALLDSPHYGERWARHWLDVARYADSNGMEIDADRPNAYRYRDFVIRALNDDLPFDTFVRWQLAGDEIAPSKPDAIAATGFIAAGVNTILPDQQMVEEKLRNRANELDDMVSTTAQALLGLTLACARCHDHKYDPLPTRDYYRLMRVFNGGDRAEVPMASPEVVAVHRKAKKEWTQAHESAVRERDAWLREARRPLESRLRGERIEQLDVSGQEKRLLNEDPDDSEAKKLADRFKKELRIADADYVSALPAEGKAHWREFNHRIDALSRQKPEDLPMAFGFADYGPEPAETWLFERGDFMARNEKMDLGFISVLTSGRTPEDYWDVARRSRQRDDSTQQRQALASWMTDVDQGAGALLARVMVNRIWQHHFGQGIVRTPSDFGSRGERPSHPDLLEWLAGEFVRSGWSIKRLHRLILNSAVYQQASDYDLVKTSIDPENRLLWRQRPVRLEAEMLRDTMLVAAGTLNRRLYGPSFKPPIPLEAIQARNVKNPYPKDAQDTPETRRRSIYMFHKRVVQYPLMQAFDAPDAQQSCGMRMNTTVAPQALAMLNDPFVRLRALELAKQVRLEAGGRIEDQVFFAFQLSLNRAPAPEELVEVSAFIKQQSLERARRGESDGSLLALTDFCHSLFGLNEFIYVD
ncbi:DUF1549 and DUF1553 domain-containing protein, partial [Verrucomicrobia bacterium]|nr:DUF1549 and DUF1553 domain-containing protein [Verrucomicrobiota bacterium]